MNAVLLWVLLPAAIGGFSLFLPRRLSLWLSGGVAVLLALAALFVRIGQPLPFVGLPLDDTLFFFGRSIVVQEAARPWLVFWFAGLTLWLLTALAWGSERFLGSTALISLSLWIAALGVQPFVYAAIFIFLSVLLWLPVLLPAWGQATRAVQRFYTLQLLAVPFLLFVGWMLAGVESLPGQGALAQRAGVLLALGFAFLLGVFPFHTWYPALMEFAPVGGAGLLLTFFPTVALHMSALFLDRYAWLHESPQTVAYLLLAGRMTFAAAGLLAALDSNLKRIWGYTLMAATGSMVIALGHFPQQGIGLLATMLLPYALTSWLGTFALAHLSGEMYFRDVQDLARRKPWVAAGILVAFFSFGGLPLLAIFPTRQVLWQAESGSIWMLVGQMGLWAASLRTLNVFLMEKPAAEGEPSPWGTRLLLGFGISLNFLVGLFPRVFLPLMGFLSGIFEHL